MVHMRCSRSLSCTPSARSPLRHAAARRSAVSWRACALREPETEPVANPFAELTTYKDSKFDKFFINLLNRKISEEVGIVPSTDGYDGFVEISRELMRNKSFPEQKQAVLAVLFSLLPGVIPWACKKFFRPNKLTCFVNAYMASIGFKWLVGDMELKQIEVEQPDGTLQLQTSQVLIKKCRYLEQSGCVGLCVNICKVPTQDFFTNDFGMPLYMEPNFEDLSCKMNFGQKPPPVEQDPAHIQPCFTQCDMSKVAKKKCFTLRDK